MKKTLSDYIRSKLYLTRSLLYNAVCRFFPNLHAFLLGPLHRWRRNGHIIEYMRTHEIRKLNLGCGGNVLTGWLNVDLYENDFVLYVDITNDLLFPDRSFDYIFAEHVIEHIPPEKFPGFLKEIRRVLRPGGILRLATPDLDFFINLVATPDSPAAMAYLAHYARSNNIFRSVAEHAINSIFYDHGHRIIFNESMLSDGLAAAGFINFRRYTAGQSDIPLLTGIEGHGKVSGVGEEINMIETLVIEAGIQHE